MAYVESGIGWEDIDMVESQDAFTICELLYYETMHFCEEGEGVKMLREGEVIHYGRVVFNSLERCYLTDI